MAHYARELKPFQQILCEYKKIQFRKLFANNLTVLCFRIKTSFLNILNRRRNIYRIFNPIKLTRFKDKNPSAVEEQKNAETKLNGVAESFDVVNVIIEALPKVLTSRVE